jgi:hypothetical protein
MDASSAGKHEYGVKEDESSTWHIWAAGFHHVMACSCLAGVLKLMNHLFLNFPTESADTGARLYNNFLFYFMCTCSCESAGFLTFYSWGLMLSVAIFGVQQHHFSYKI